MDGKPGLFACAALALGSVLGPAPSAAEEESAADIMPPRLHPPGDLSDCYPIGSAMLGREGSMTVTVVVQPDGTATDLLFPVGAEHWQREAAKCVIQRLRFIPATKGGMAVAARASVPVVFGLRGSSGSVPAFNAPQMRSDDASTEAAYRECYPAGMAGVQTPTYKFTIGVDGRARNIRLVKSGGSPPLDKAGECVIKRLQFRPLLRGSQAVRSTVSWPILVRPAKEQP